MKILGINDDVTTCECCGRTGLKKTVVIETSETGIVHYGSNCAARKLGRTKTQVERTAETRDREAADAFRQTVHTVGDVRSVIDWVIELNGDILTWANGSKRLVSEWAAAQWPEAIVRLPVM